MVVYTEHVQTFLLLSLFPKQYNYLHIIYIVLGIVSNLEMIVSIQKDVCRLYAKTTPFYIGETWASVEFGTCRIPIPHGY